MKIIHRKIKLCLEKIKKDSHSNLIMGLKMSLEKIFSKNLQKVLDKFKNFCYNNLVSAIKRDEIKNATF